MRKIFITDIHSEYRKTQALLNKVNYNPAKDLLILGGDYFDRGPESVLVAKWLEEIYTQKNVILLRGNHDIALMDLLDYSWKTSISAYVGIENMIKINGMDITVEDLMGTPRKQSYQEYADKINKRFPRLLDALKSTVWYYETEDAIFTHAALPENYENVTDDIWQHWVWEHTHNWALKYGDRLPKKTYVGHFAFPFIDGWDGSDVLVIDNVVMCDGGLGQGYDGLVTVI